MNTFTLISFMEKLSLVDFQIAYQPLCMCAFCLYPENTLILCDYVALSEKQNVFIYMPFRFSKSVITDGKCSLRNDRC